VRVGFIATPHNLSLRYWKFYNTMPVPHLLYLIYLSTITTPSKPLSVLYMNERINRVIVYFHKLLHPLSPHHRERILYTLKFPEIEHPLVYVFVVGRFSFKILYSNPAV
jgi:hypothetical protein